MTWARSADRPLTTWNVLARFLYWLAVLAVSLALVFLLLRFFEERDEPQLEQPAAAVTGERPAAVPSRAA